MGAELFFELIQVSLCNRERLSRQPSESEWMQLYALAEKQSLTGVLLEGVEKLKSIDSTIAIPQALLLNWIGERLLVEARNKLLNERTKELWGLLQEAGFRSCVLKGQGTALYYPHPEYRLSGDIDIWVEGNRDKVLSYIKTGGYSTDGIDVQHTNVKVFNDVEVEVHFLPSFMYNPFVNRRLQKFFNEKSNEEFNNINANYGFARTKIDFDIVFSLVHIYRHIFSEGIGLRQLMDYYYILCNSSQSQRAKAFEILCALHMKSFAEGVMWILQSSFGMKNEYMLCPVNKTHGEFLLSEILTAGNFGHYDERMKRIDHHKRFARGVIQFKKNLRFVSFYPSEVLWSPFWKLWHWCWRKSKGYL